MAKGGGVKKQIKTVAPVVKGVKAGGTPITAENVAKVIQASKKKPLNPLLAKMMGNLAK